MQRAFGSRICLLRTTEASATDEYLGGLGAHFGDPVEEAEARVWRFVQNIAPPGTARTLEYAARIAHDPARAVSEQARTWQATLVVATSGGAPHALAQ